MDKASFVGAVMSDVSFRSVSLSEASFLEARLFDIHFHDVDGLTQASFDGACGREVSGLPDGITLPACQ